MVEKEVLGLQISVDNLVSVAVFDGAYNLLEELSGLCLLQFTVVDDVVEQFAACVFEDHDDLGRRCYDGIARGAKVSMKMRQARLQANDVQLDDVGMAQQLQILNLTLDPACHVSGDEPLAIDDLEGNLLAADLVGGQLDLAEGALAEGADNGILAEALARLCVLALCFVHRCSERRGRGLGGVLGLWGAGLGGAAPLCGHGDGEFLQVVIIDCGRHCMAGGMMAPVVLGGAGQRLLRG